jgi:SAM-dependent methyltransferase
VTTTSSTSNYSLNAEYWTRIIREDLDPYRIGLTNPAILDAAGDVTGKAVLDAGCGEGYLSRLLADRGAGPVTGVDLCPELVDAARDRAVADGLPVTYQVGDVADLPIADRSIDLVVANHVLNDLEDPVPAVAEFARVLRPGGHAVALLLHPCFYGSRGVPVDIDTYFQPRRIEQHFNVAGLVSPAPVVAWARSLEDFAGAFTSAGLAITRIQEPHPTERQRRDNPWWDQNFTRPLFVLIAARKG